MKNENALPGFILAIILVPVLLRLLAIGIDLPRLWGLDYLTYFSPIEIALWSILAVAAILFVRLKEKHVNKTSVVLASVIFLVLSVMLIAYPVTTFYYGDGSLLVPQIFRFTQTGVYDTSLIINAKSAILSGLAIDTFTQFIPNIFSNISTITYPFIAVSGIAIVILFLLYWFYLRKECDGGIAQVLFVLGTAGIVFFLGYVEYYTLPFVLIAGYLIAGDSAIRMKGRKLPVVVLYVLAITSHYMALALFPSFLYVLLTGSDAAKKWRSRKSVLLVSVGVLIVWAVVYIGFGFWNGDGRIVMSVESITTGAGTQSYTLLSSYHILDLVNIFLLLAPIQFFVLLVTLVKHRETARSEVSVFYGLALLFFVMFLFFANTSLGLARDWDIAAPLGVIVSLYAYRMLMQTEENGIKIALAIGAAAFIFALPWAVLHIDEEGAAERFENVLRLDDTHMFGDYALSGYEALRKHYLHEGDHEKEVEITKRMIEILDYPEHYRLLENASLMDAVPYPDRYVAMQVWMLERLKDRAGQLKRNGVESDYSTSMLAIDSLVTSVTYNAVVQNREQTIIPLLKEISQITGYATPMNVLAGIKQYSAGNYVAAAGLLKQVVQTSMQTEKLYGFVASALLLSGDKMGARSFYERGRTEFPNGYELPMMYAIAHIQSGISQESTPYLDLALQNTPPEDVRARLKAIRDQIQP